MKRPNILMNMASSVDGKISTYNNIAYKFSSTYDTYMMDVIRAKVDAVIMGANSLRAGAPPIRIRSKKIYNLTKKHPINVILSNDLKIPIDSKLFQFKDTKKLIFTTKSSTLKKQRQFSKVAELIILKKQPIDPRDVVTQLSKRGVKTLLIEGGGQINFSFFKYHLVDELFLTVCPKIIGGIDAPTIVEGSGFDIPHIIDLKLIKSRVVNNELFTHYRLMYKQ